MLGRPHRESTRSIAGRHWPRHELGNDTGAVQDQDGDGKTEEFHDAPPTAICSASPWARMITSRIPGGVQSA